MSQREAHYHEHSLSHPPPPAHPPVWTGAMNQPYRLDAEAIARRLNPSARRSPSGWWPLPGICHDRRDRPTPGSPRQPRARRLRRSLGQVLGRMRPRLCKAIDRGRHGMAHLGTADTRLPCPTAHRTGLHGHRSQYPTAGSTPGSSGEPPYAQTGTRTIPCDAGWRGRSLYWPAPVPLPSAVRWLPAGLFHQQHEGAGAIAAAFAPPDHWTAVWPRAPVPTGVELVHIDAEGAPALDKPAAEEGLSKRSYGVRQGAVCILGDPRPDSAVGLILVEGLADALALASRYPETAAAVGGVSGMQADRLLDWLAAWPSVTLYADDDPDGIDGARRLRRLLAHRGLDITVYTLGAGHNDPGEYAADNPLADVDLDAAREFAADLIDEGLPQWEAARLAMMIVGSPADANVMSTTSPT